MLINIEKRNPKNYRRCEFDTLIWHGKEGGRGAFDACQRRR